MCFSRVLSCEEALTGSRYLNFVVFCPPLEDAVPNKCRNISHRFSMRQIILHLLPSFLALTIVFPYRKFPPALLKGCSYKGRNGGSCLEIIFSDGWREVQKVIELFYTQMQVVYFFFLLNVLKKPRLIGFVLYNSTTKRIISRKVT